MRLRASAIRQLDNAHFVAQNGLVTTSRLEDPSYAFTADEIQFEDLQQPLVDPLTGGPHTAHTTNPVPLLIVDPDGAVPLRAGGALCDVGPTVLELLGLTIPPEMDGRTLRAAAVPA